MGSESEAAQVLNDNQVDSVGETVAEDVAHSQGTDAPGQASPQSPSDDTTNLADADAASDAPSNDTTSDDEYANQALEILASINKQLTPSASPPAEPKGKDAEAPSGSTDKKPEAETDDLEEILKSAREDFGDELPDKVLKPLAAKIESRVAKQFEPILKYAQAKIREDQERQVKDQEQAIDTALKALYSTADSAIKQAIGASYDKASAQQKLVVREIFAAANGLMIGGQNLGKSVSIGDAVKQAIAATSQKIRTSPGYKAAQQRNRSRTVATPNSRSAGPTVQDDDKDRAESLAVISQIMGRR